MYTTSLTGLYIPFTIFVLIRISHSYINMFFNRHCSKENLKRSNHLSLKLAYQRDNTVSSSGCFYQCKIYVIHIKEKAQALSRYIFYA